MERNNKFVHIEFDDLLDLDEIEYSTDLICPILSNQKHLINCVGKICAFYKNCFKEMNYNENLNKFFKYTQLIIMLFIALGIILF